MANWCAAMIVVLVLATVAVVASNVGGSKSGMLVIAASAPPGPPCDQNGMCPFPYSCRGGRCRYNGDCSGGCDPGRGLACAGGACVDGTTSCFSWASFSPRAGRLPKNIMGYRGGPLVPVGAQGPDGKWYLGATPASPANPYWGRFTCSSLPSGTWWSIDRMWYLTVNASLGSVCATASWPLRSADAPQLTFNGIPVYWDASETTNAFAPSAGWAGMGQFIPVANVRPCDSPNLECQPAIPCTSSGQCPPPLKCGPMNTCVSR